MTPTQTKLFEQHRDLIERVARAVWRRWPGLNGLALDDYRQEAAIGLMAAVKKFRRSHKVPFDRFAYMRIWGTVVSAIRRADRLSRQHRAEGSAPEIVSLDAAVSDDGDRLVALRERLLCAADDRSEAIETFEAVGAILSILHPEARPVVYMATVLEMPIWQIAAVCGRTRPYISTLRDMSMKQLARCHAWPARRSGRSDARQLRLWDWMELRQ